MCGLALMTEVAFYCRVHELGHFALSYAVNRVLVAGSQRHLVGSLAGDNSGKRSDQLQIGAIY